MSAESRLVGLELLTLSRALEYFEKNKESIAEGLSLQMGKPKTQAVGEINTMIDRANTMIQFAPRSLQDIVFDSVKNGERTLYKKIVKEPIGPVLILSPWNYPYICTINTLIPALLAGNSVLVKHSDRTSLCSNMFQRAFEFAGAPKNLVTVCRKDFSVFLT
jgi:acyl-CoA reductase-like NAD-dependent aldehyde dehydrogenase